MALNKLENEIFKLVDNNHIDINKVNELFKAGANPNALLEEKVEKNDDCTYYSTFFSECIFEAQSKSPDLFPLLKCFVENGLDVNKYGPSIIGDFCFIYKNSDIYEMTKYMLNHMDKDNCVNQALMGIGTEESYYNCCEHMDSESNELASIYEIIDAFANGKEFNDIYCWKRIIGQKVKSVKVSGNKSNIDGNVFICESENDGMKTLIECEKDSLYVIDSNMIFVNNSIGIDKYSEEYSRYLSDNLKGETIEKVEFEHTMFVSGPKTYSQGRIIIISFSNNKKLLYKYLRDDKQFALLFVDMTDKNILKEYTDVFVEKEFNVLDKRMSTVKPDMTGMFKIFHNCDVNSGARYLFSFVDYYDEKESNDYIKIDEESFEILRPYIDKYNPDFDQYDSLNPIKDRTYVKIQKDIISLIEDLENDNITEEYKACVSNSKWCFDGFSYEDDIYLHHRFDDIKPIIIRFLKAFIWYIGEYHCYAACLDDKLLNVVGY